MDVSWIRTLAPDPLAPPSVPQCQADTVARAVERLGPTATAWAIQTASDSARKAMVHRDGAEVAEVQLRPVRRAGESCVLAVLAGLMADLPAEELDSPVELRQAIHDAVHAGVPLERVLRTMWSAHMATVDALLARLSAPADRRAYGRSADLALWAREERRVRRLSFAYLEAFSDTMTRDYLAERDAWAGSLSSARRAIVTDIVEGRRVVTRDAEATLGIRLTDPHLALIIWADHENSDAELDSNLMATAGALARAAHATSTLTVHGAPATMWTWLGWRRNPDLDRVVELVGRVEPPAGIRIATGPIGSGTAGFRRSHRCAREAQRISAVTAGAFCHHADVAVLSLLTVDTEQARWFVDATLGRLADDEPRTAELRDTLHAYLASGRSRSAAAERLHIASGTVAYRLRQAEQLLGKPITGTGRDIELALEILPTLGPPPR